MSFARRIYAVRFDSQQLTQRLLGALDREFSQFEDVPGMLRNLGDLGGRGSRCRERQGLFSSRRVCNFAPTPADKRVVRGILRAWRRQVSDRFLDYSLVRYREHLSFESMEACYADMRRDAYSGPAAERGCVDFVSRSIRRSSLPLFGEHLRPDLNFNQYYTALLAWDDDHLTGLIQHIRDLLNRMAPADGGEHVLPVLYQAARLFVSRAQQVSTPQTVYGAILGSVSRWAD